MLNSPWNCKIWCRFDANPVSCNWGLIERWISHLIIVVISDLRCKKPIESHHDSNEHKMRPVKIFTSVIQSLRVITFCFYKPDQTQKSRGGKRRNQRLARHRDHSIKLIQNNSENVIFKAYVVFFQWLSLLLNEHRVLYCNSRTYVPEVLTCISRFLNE